MHPVHAELARGVAGSGRLAFRVAALLAAAIGWLHSVSRSGADQEHFVSTGKAAGIQGLVDVTWNNVGRMVDRLMRQERPPREKP